MTLLECITNRIMLCEASGLGIEESVRLYSKMPSEGLKQFLFGLSKYIRQPEKYYKWCCEKLDFFFKVNQHGQQRQETIDRLYKCIQTHDELRRRRQLESAGVPADLSQLDMNTFLDLMQRVSEEPIENNKLDSIEGQYRQVYNSNNWAVYMPKTFEAERVIGTNTHWCTVGSEDWWNEYAGGKADKGRLYINIPKKNGVPDFKSRLKTQCHTHNGVFYIAGTDDTVCSTFLLGLFGAIDCRSLGFADLNTAFDDELRAFYKQRGMFNPIQVENVSEAIKTLLDSLNRQVGLFGVSANNDRSGIIVHFNNGLMLSLTSEDCSLLDADGEVIDAFEMMYNVPNAGSIVAREVVRAIGNKI